MKKILAALLVISMIATLALSVSAIADWSGIDSENVPYSSKDEIVTPKFKPEIDAVKDAGYTTTYEVKETQSNFLPGTTVSTAWSGNTLYFFMEVPDTTPQDDISNLWNYQRDGVWFMLFFGGDQASHVMARQSDDFKGFKVYPAVEQLNFEDALYQGYSAPPSVNDIEFAIDYQASGYTLEVAYTVPEGTSVLTKGQEIAFDMEVCDMNDSTNSRYCLSNPNLNSIENYCTALGAKLVLADFGIDWTQVDSENVPYSVKLPIETPSFMPTLDGAKDAGYTTTYEVKSTNGNFLPGTTVSTAWNGNTLYFFMEVPDTTPQESIDGLWNYQRDGVWFMLFFGGDQASHVLARQSDDFKGFKVYPAVEQLNFEDALYQGFSAPPSVDDIEFAIDYQASGYTLEVAYTVPTDFAVLAADQEIAFDMQVCDMNDSTTSRYYLANPNDNSTENYCTALAAKLVLQQGTAPANGIVEIDGELYYQENGVGVMAGLILIDGDYYFAAYNGKIVTSKMQNIWANSTDDDSFTYRNFRFGPDGKMVDHDVDDGVYYEGGKPKMAGLVKVGDTYYFAGNEGIVATNKNQYIWKNSTGETEFDDRSFLFGADGKIANGLVELDDGTYYYVNGKPKMNGLVKVGDTYYFAGGAGKIVKDKLQFIWLNSTGETRFDERSFLFGADGAIANGIFEVEGVDYFYKDGKPFMAGLVKIGDDYYFATGGGQIVKNKRQNIWLNSTGDTSFDGRNFDFGADGRMVV